MITASTDAKVRSAAIDNGAVAVLLKPVETDLLRETVAGVLDVELTDRGTV